jgi:peptidoglycan/xylan/chitin deacetylase (PgdA/CDA1 family)
MLSPGGVRARLSILIFHSVWPQADPLRPGSITAQDFDQLMGFVAETFNVLPLAEAVERLVSGRLPPRSLCITFDDGYADNHDVALPILKQWNLSATFFVATAFLDGGRMWNDAVIEALRVAPGPELNLDHLDLGVHAVSSWQERREAVDRLLLTLKYLPASKRTQRVTELVAAAGGGSDGRLLMMTSAQVRELHNSGMEIGGHTVNHPILFGMSPAQARDEILQGRETLEEWVAAPIRLFAYPNGKPDRDYAREHVEIVRRAGFTAAVTTSWGSSVAATDPLQLPRFTPWNRDPLRFGLRLLQNCWRRGESAGPG